MIISHISSLNEVQLFCQNAQGLNWDSLIDPSGRVYFKLENIEIYSTPNFMTNGVCSIEIYEDELLKYSEEYEFSELNQNQYINNIIDFINKNNLLKTIIERKLYSLGNSFLASLLSDIWIEDPKKDYISDLDHDDLVREILDYVDNSVSSGNFSYQDWYQDILSS